MSEPSLELAKIPSRSIAEWRTEEGLQQAHLTSEILPTYSTLHAVAGEYLTLGVPDRAGQLAISKGIAIAEVAHFREASIGLAEFPDVPATNRVVGALLLKMSAYTQDLEFTRNSVGRVENRAPLTLASYERVARPHVDHDKRKIKLARHGAAFMHSLLCDAEDLAREAAEAEAERERIESYRAPVISLVERLTLAP